MIRTATWNMQAVMPVRSDGKWEYLHDVVRPDVAVLTEAKPEEAGYRLFYREGGLGNRRRWGTIVATAPTVDATELTTVRRGLRDPLTHRNVARIRRGCGSGYPCRHRLSRSSGCTPSLPTTNSRVSATATTRVVPS